MIRTVLFITFLALYLILTYPILLILKVTNEKHKERNDRIAFRMTQWACRILLFITGAKITVLGEENIPEEPVLFVGNHRSYFDIPLGYTRLKAPCGYVAKIELAKFPILSQWMPQISCLFLDRQDIKQGLKTILAGVQQVKNGTSVWIYPEGTRSHMDEMLEFKEGSMKIAEKSGCPIIPVAIKGSDDIFEKHVPALKAVPVTIQFGEPIYPNELTRDEKKVLGATTRAKIQEMLDAMEK